MDTPDLLLDEFRREFRTLREQAERALAQVDDAGFFAARGGEANSLAVLVKHVGGNLKSRWTDFLTSDGEKPDRQRDNEFEILPGDTRDALMARWSEGWHRVLETLDSLKAEDLTRTVVIRWEPVTMPRAVLRSLTHTAGHVGQMVLLAKHAAGDQWQTLSIPRGQSEQVNARQREKFAERYR